MAYATINDPSEHFGTILYTGTGTTGHPVVGVNFCKTRFNEHEEELFIETWKDKVDFIVIQDFQPPDLTKDYSEFLTNSTSVFREKIQNSGFNCQQPWQRVLIRSNGEV